MGMRRWCSIESKTFELAVEGNSSGVRIIECCRGVVRSVFLGRIDCRWLLATVEELLRERESKVFWRRSRTSFLAILNQRCSNKNGRFLVLEEHGGGRCRGHILVPKGGMT